MPTFVLPNTASPALSKGPLKRSKQKNQTPPYREIQIDKLFVCHMIARLLMRLDKLLPLKLFTRARWLRRWRAREREGGGRES